MLLKLDLEGKCNTRRREILSMRDACEDVLLEQKRPISDKTRAALETCLQTILDILARRKLFLFVYGISVSEELVVLLSQRENEIRSA